jgi:tRNA A37 threonylcarbamoyladenosine synthetase subunit TsaC/SUA5/YrdC
LTPLVQKDIIALLWQRKTSSVKNKDSALIAIKVGTLQLDFYEKHHRDFITFLLPAHISAPPFCVRHGKIALRFTIHQSIQELSKFFQNPIFSTSANITGQKLFLSRDEIIKKFPGVKIINGTLGGREKASASYNLVEEVWLRQ